MEKRWAKKIAQRMKEKGCIPEQETALYEYGFELLISSVFSIASIIILASAYGKLCFSFGYLLGFILIRIFVGGYHAKTHLKCYMIFTFIYAICEFANTKIQLRKNEAILICVILFLLIYFFAPVQARNKPLKRREISGYKKMSYLILTGDLIYLSISDVTKDNVQGFIFGLIACILLMIIQIVIDMLADINKIQGGT